MQFSHSELQKTLASWGKNKQTPAPSSNEIKKNILAMLPTQTTTRYFKRGWLAGFAVAGIALLIIFVNHASNTRYDTSTASIYQESRIAAGFPTEKPTSLAEEELGIQYGQPTGLSAAATPGWIKTVAPLFDETEKSDEIPANDAREYLKTGYTASAETRNVTRLTLQLETLVRGHGGRIDSFSSNNRYGDITFVLPKQSLEAFRRELVGLVPERFLNETIQAQNLLPQKNNLDDEQASSEAELKSAQDAEADLIKTHTQTIGNLQAQINTHTKSIQVLSRATAPTPEEATRIAASITAHNQSIAYLRQQLIKENNDFALKQSDSEETITYLQSELASLKKQNTQLIDSVETIQGSISISWISLGEFLEAYLPYFREILVTLGVVGALLYWRFGRTRRLQLPS